MKKLLTVLVAVFLLAGLAYAPIINPHFITNYLEVFQKNHAPGLVIKNAAVFDPAYAPLSFQDSTGTYVGSMFIDPTGNIFIGDKTAGTLYGSIVIGSMAGGYLDLVEYVSLFGIGAGQNMVAGGYTALLGPGAGDIPAYSNFLTVTGVYSSPYIYSVTFSATPSAGAGLEIGNYRYLFTYVLDGAETACSNWHALTTPTTSGNQQVSITGIPTYDGPRICTARKLYRTKVSTSENLAKFYLLATLADNITTIYLDSTADAALGAILSKIDDIAVFGNWLLQIIMPDTLYLGGGAGHDMPNVVFGDEWDATPVGTTLHSQGGQGSNIAGADFTIAPGQGTGTGASGSFVVKTAKAGTTSSSWNPLATALSIGPDKTVKSGQTSVSLADNAVHDTGVVSFYGLLIVKDTTTGVAAVYRLDGGATPVAVSAHANFSTTQGTDNKVNVYFSTTYKIENCNTAASVVTCAFVGTL